ncbi:MAG: MATE family efflux transporter [Spirochaetales bacterium]|nr:MAG: MATE family efflux transporter [Spirochaetales bacterium]
MVQQLSESRTVWKIAWPLILTNILNVLVGIVDLKMVGALGVAAIAAVGMGRQVMNLVFVIMIAISGGSSIVIARAFGAGNRESVSIVGARTLVYMAFTAVLLVTPLGYFTSRPFLIALGGDAEVVELGSQYLRIIFLGSLFTMFNFGITSVLLGVGRTQISLVLLLCVNSLNIVFNYIFIFGAGPIPPLGIAGAAWGTVVSRGLGMVAGIGIAISPRFPIKADFRKAFVLDWHLIGQIVKLGGPRSLQGVVRNLSRLLTIRIITLLAGATAMISAYSVGMQVRMTSTFVGLAFMQAAAVRVSQNMGAKNTDRAVASGCTASVMAMGIMSFLAVLMILFPEQIMGFFTTDPEVIAMGRSFFVIVAISEPVMAFAFAIGGALRGGGDSVSPFIYSSISDVVVVSAAGYIFAVTLGMGFPGIALGLAISSLTRAIPTTLKYRQGKWKSIRI